MKPIMHDELRMAIHNYLRGGFGVEDIVVKTRAARRKASLKMVRAEIDYLRSTGELVNILGLRRDRP